MAPSASSLHARVAAFSRSRPLDDPDFVAARRDLAAVRLEEHVRYVVASAPPLTEEQRARVVAALDTRATSSAAGGLILSTRRGSTNTKETN